MAADPAFGYIRSHFGTRYSCIFSPAAVWSRAVSLHFFGALALLGDRSPFAHSSAAAKP